mmetsp:Transcript_58801/g.140174  ORF Transcript_58801/g.140174 Transcript_58801/m.140174 type:complete len:223 (+) Transcript_58801:44-712(+)
MAAWSQQMTPAPARTIMKVSETPPRTGSTLIQRVLVLLGHCQVVCHSSASPAPPHRVQVLDEDATAGCQQPPPLMLLLEQIGPEPPQRGEQMMLGEDDVDRDPWQAQAKAQRMNQLACPLAKPTPWTRHAVPKSRQRGPQRPFRLPRSNQQDWRQRRPQWPQHRRLMPPLRLHQPKTSPAIHLSRSQHPLWQSPLTEYSLQSAQLNSIMQCQSALQVTLRVA